jgi:hypothetical protein
LILCVDSNLRVDIDLFASFYITTEVREVGLESYFMSPPDAGDRHAFLSQNRVIHLVDRVGLLSPSRSVENESNGNSVGMPHIESEIRSAVPVER